MECAMREVCTHKPITANIHALAVQYEAKWEVCARWMRTGEEVMAIVKENKRRWTRAEEKTEQTQTKERKEINTTEGKTTKQRAEGENWRFMCLNFNVLQSLIQYAQTQKKEFTGEQKKKKKKNRRNEHNAKKCAKWRK